MSAVCYSLLCFVILVTNCVIGTPSLEETIDATSADIEKMRTAAGQLTSEQLTSGQEEELQQQLGPDIQKLLTRYGGHPLGYLLRRFFSETAADKASE